MVGLGDLAGGGFDSIAYGVSADGNVVVGQGLAASGSEAFRWTQATGMQTVTQWLTDNGVGAGGFTQLVVANAISADGSTIVGRGTNTSAQQEAFLARVMPAATTPSFLIGMTDFTTSVGSLTDATLTALHIQDALLEAVVPHLSEDTASGFSAGPLAGHVSGSSGDIAGFGLDWRTHGIALTASLAGVYGENSSYNDAESDYRGAWGALSANASVGELFNYATLNPLEIAVALSHGVYNADMERRYFQGATLESASGDTTLRVTNVLARLGWRFQLRNNLELQPYLQAQHNSAEADSYFENSATFTARISEQEQNNWQETVGVIGNWQVNDKFGLSARYGYNFLNDDEGATVSAAITSLGTFTPAGISYDQQWHEGELRARYNLTQRFVIYAGAGATSGSNYPEDWHAHGGISYRF